MIDDDDDDDDDTSITVKVIVTGFSDCGFELNNKKGMIDWPHEWMKKWLSEWMNE